MRYLFQKLQAFIGGLLLGSKTTQPTRQRTLEPVSDSQMYFAEDENILHDIQYKVMSGNRIMDMHTGEIIESFSKRNAAHYVEDQKLLIKQARLMMDPEEYDLVWKVRDSKLEGKK